MEIGVFPIVGEAEDGNRHFLSFRAGEKPKNAQYLLRERSDFQISNDGGGAEDAHFDAVGEQ
jgi:hypothetical protein